MKLAIFDLDGTLLPIDSGDNWPIYLAAAEPELCGWGKERAETFARNESLGNFDPLAFALFNFKLLSLLPIERLLEIRRAYVEDFILPRVKSDAFELVNRAKAEGFYTLQISGTIAFVSAEIGRYFGFDRAIAVDAVTDSRGNFLPRLASGLSFQSYKIRRLELFLHGLGVSSDSLEDLTFYTDSNYDMPLIEYVLRKGGRAYAVNPNAKLTQYAQRAGLPIIRFY